MGNKPNRLLTRGTHQVCPLSPLLFAIILLHADDILFTITNPQMSLPELMNCIRITSKLSQLYDTNIKTSISRIKEDFTRWSKLPVSFSGRINLIRIIIFPKILYPLSITFFNLTNADIKDLNKAVSKFIWANNCQNMVTDQKVSQV
uniref:Reverse transcriptase domain-containing protein n=1 Tax=Cyprinus carpio TaxID=7962 RepID=A0A8C2H4V8_CYPCA